MGNIIVNKRRIEEVREARKELIRRGGKVRYVAPIFPAESDRIEILRKESRKALLDLIRSLG